MQVHERTRKSNATLKLAILCVAMLNNVMGSATSALGTIASIFPDASYTVVSMISTVPPLIMSVVPFFYTPLITHVRKRSILWLSAVLLLVGGLGPAVFHTNIYVILIFRIILGFAVGFCTILSIDLIVDFFDGKEKHTLTGMRDTFNSLGGAAFTLIGGWLAGIQWYYCFWAVLLGFAFIAIPLIFLPEPDRKAKMEFEKEVLGNQSVDVKVPGSVWLFSIFALLHWIFFYVFITNVAMIVISEQIATPAQSGMIYAFINVGTIIFGLIFGKVFQKIKYVTLFIGMGLGGVALLIASNAVTTGVFIIGAICLGAGSAFLMPSIYAKNGSLTPYKNQSKAISIVSFMIGVGGFLSPFIFNSFGLDGRTQCVVGGILYIVCGALAMILAFVIKPKHNYDLSEYSTH